MIDTNAETPVALVEVIRTRVGEWTSFEGRASIRVSLAGPGPTPTTCEVWTAAPDGRWIYIKDLYSGIEASMLDLGRAIVLAGYACPLTPEGRPAWQADCVETTTYTLNVTRP